MNHAYAMVAKHLMQIDTHFENGIPYHYTTPEKVNQIKDLVKRAAVVLDYGLPTDGTAHLRLNYQIREGSIPESWACGGGVLTSEDVDAQIEHVKNTVIQDGKTIKDTNLTCYILNEWERYVVVFELTVVVG